MALPASPDRPARPGTVSAANYLLYAMAALVVADSIVTFGGTNAAGRAAMRAGAPDPATADTLASFWTGILIVVVVAEFLFAAALFTLAVLTGNGSNVARIITWVVAGLAICCCGLSLTGGGGRGIARYSGTSGSVNQAEVQRVMQQQIPGWLEPVNLVITALIVLAAIGVVILLALPASHPYFRRTPPGQGWEPPVPPPIDNG